VVKLWQRRRLPRGLQRGEGSRSVSVGFQPGTSGQSGGDDDHVTQQRGRNPSRVADADVAFHSGPRQQQVTGLTAGTGPGRQNGAADRLR
jgi:hypothetical protein